jgi:hypothetical protein
VPSRRKPEYNGRRSFGEEFSRLQTKWERRLKPENSRRLR